MPSIWADEPDNQPTGAGPSGPEQPAPDPLFVERAVQSQQPAQGSAPREEEQYDREVRLPPRIRTQFGGGLRTAGDAFLVCEALFQEQLERAAAEKPAPNQAIQGDSGAHAPPFCFC